MRLGNSLLAKAILFVASVMVPSLVGLPAQGLPVPTIGLDPGQSLATGELLQSPSGTYRLSMQTDGNLVEYVGSTPLWASATSGSSNHVTIQSDGNLVVYSSSGQALWQSATSGNPGAYLRLQNDGNLVIYGGGGGALWARSTSRTGSWASNTLHTGESVQSGNGQNKLIMQADGNLVEYTNGTARWATDTSGTSNRAVMQPDGNLVVYSSGGGALWQSGTGGTPGSPTLNVQNDGNVVIYEVTGPTWARSSSKSSSYVSNTVWPGQSIRSPGGRYRLTMQTDGNLVEYGPNGAIWWTSTEGSTNHLTMQSDGNLVVYRSDGRALWQSGTVGNPRGLNLAVQNDGNVVIYRGGAGAIWARSWDPDAASVTWAMAHNGQYVGAAYEQPNTPQHQWSGYCWTFVFDAFGGKAVSGMPSAQAAFNYYNARGMIRKSAPPTGSIAFFSYGSDGHAAVGVGGGQIIGTKGTSAERYPVYQVDYQSLILPYLGWVIP